ncbi:tripartite motif-containing protein 45 isoform X1 [Esox lucius]|uniref:RING-type E3 ubiquitin transferase n=1 Tax=Esox lucius TaxID=8010 RepID=A0A3P8ZKT4_ESOLU|nr:tripartite motif-containing protein 45 isoform X1 [Esox lucius]
MSVCAKKLDKDDLESSPTPTTNSMSKNGDNGDIVVNTRAECSVCKRLYRDPKILPCLHTFCADCVRQLEPFSVLSRVNNSKAAPSEREPRSSAVTVLCPECDSEVDIPLSGVDGLTTDHLALDEVFFQTLMTENNVLCDLCSDGDAEKRCEVCCVNLCEFCCQAHRRQKRTSSHTVQCLESLKTQGRLSRPVLCSLHPGQELRLFCESCDLPICLECAATYHRDHRCRSTRDVIARHGDRIREMVTGRLRPRLVRLEESLRKVDQSQDALQARVDAVADEVRSFARGYACAVESHCLSLLRRLEELRVQRRNQLHLQGAQLQQALTDARGGVEFAERLLTRGSDAEILSAKGVTLRRLTALVESGYDPNLATVAPDDGSSICFLPQEGAGELGGYPVVGVIHFKSLELSRCTIEGEGLQQGREGQRGEFNLVCRDSAGEPMGRGGEAVLVSMVHKEKKDCRVEATVVDNGDGSYAVSFTPVEPGLYSVWVCIKAQHVKGSPFVLNVKRKVRRHRGTFHCCSFCSSGGSKEARCGCPGSMPGGVVELTRPHGQSLGGFQGCGHGHKGHPGKPHWSCCGSVEEASECLPQSVITAVGGTVTTAGGRGSSSPRGHLRTVEI